jgi:hypothetical protein
MLELLPPVLGLEVTLPEELMPPEELLAPLLGLEAAPPEEL